MRKAFVIITFVLVAGTATIGASPISSPRWAEPDSTAVKRVGDTSAVQTHSVAFGNLDCTEITYRLAGSSGMRSGCFTPTAFGMVDSDYDIVIFNGTDEGLPLRSSVAHRVFVPWPDALNLLAIDPVDTGGSYVKIYRSPLSGLKDQRDLEGRLTGKQLSAPPDINLTDPAGKPLVVNPNDIAFSDGGSWMVTETLSGSFVRINLASMDRLEFAPSFAVAGWPGTLFNSQVAVSENGRYVAIGNSAADSLKVYDLRDCGGKTCASHDYLPFLKQNINGLKNVRDIRFLNDGLLSFEATGNGGGGVYELAPSGSIPYFTDYIGLGDSYTSGEGAFDYLDGTDTSDNACHLSVESYPLLMVHDLFSAEGGHSVACSGARINDVASRQGNYRGQARDGSSLDELRESQPARLGSIMSGYLPGYVAQHRFVAQYQPQVITVSVGGNDVGFGDILERCVSPHLTRHQSDESCYNTYESRQEVVNLVDRTVKRWTSLYNQLKNEAPASTIYAIGYPSIASDIGKCPVNVRLDKNELEFAEELISYMDASIHQAATASGAQYVDISQALKGHRLCEASGNSVAVNGLTAGNDFGILGLGFLGRESYHPNALGQHLIEEAILKKTGNLRYWPSDTDATDNTVPDTGNLLDAPRTGRAVNTLVLDHITSERAEPGGNISLKIDGGRDGLRPNSAYTVRLDGSGGPLLADVESGSEGNISQDISIPQDIDPDTYVVDVLGPGQDDEQVEVAQTISVAPADNISAASDELPGENYPVGVANEREIHDGAAAGKQQMARPSPQPRASDDPAGSVAAVRSLSVPSENRQTSRPAFFMGLPAIILITLFCGLGIIKLFIHYLGYHCNNWTRKHYENYCGCFTIVIMRTFGAVVLSIILFVALLVFGFSTSSNSAITDQKKVNDWLNSSNLYGAFVENAINQAEQTAGTDQSGGVSLGDTVVKQAAEQSFSSKALQDDVDIFLNSNYAWLKGKSAKPSFQVDLSSAKNDFAARVGKYVTTYLKGLPACSAAQEANINPQDTDPLTLQCLPRGMNPTSVGVGVTQQIASSTQFLGNPVITADNINPASGNTMKPYYQRFSTLPSLYRATVNVPWIAGIVSLLSLVALFLVGHRKRRSMKIAAVVFTLAGIIMVSAKLIADSVFNTAEKHIFSSSTVGQLQKALTVFLHHVENQIVKVDLWFGIVYLSAALVLVLTLVITRRRGLRIPKRLQNLMPNDNSPAADPVGPGEAPAPKTKDQRSPSPRPTQRPRPQKPPRLIQ